MAQIDHFVQMLSQKGRDKEAYVLITEHLSNQLDVTRASLWLLNSHQDAIECLDLYDSRTKAHAGGIELEQVDFPSYFEGLLSGEVMSADNAHTHPHTSEFLEIYFDPNDIYSLLDVPIMVDGKVRGVVCIEHCAEFRTWSDAEKQSVAEIAGLMARVYGHTVLAAA